MAEAAKKYTPQDRIADGSIRITFPESQKHAVPEAYLRKCIAEFLHTNLTHAQYSKCAYVVCIGDTGNPNMEGSVEWCVPSKGVQAVPFWVKEVHVDGVRYPTRKYSLKPMRDGKVHEDTLSLIADYLESSKIIASSFQATPKVLKSPPAVFSTHFLQKFINVCASEACQFQKRCFTDAALIRIYESIDPTVKKTDIQERVQVLIERKFFTHTGTDLNEFYFGPSAQQYLPQFSGEFAESDASPADSTNEILAKAVLQKRRLQQELAAAQVRVETAEAQCLTFESRITALEAKLQKQPDIAQLVQEGVAAELQRLLLED